MNKLNELNDKAEHLSDIESCCRECNEHSRDITGYDWDDIACDALDEYQRIQREIETNRLYYSDEYLEFLQEHAEEFIDLFNNDYVKYEPQD